MESFGEYLKGLREQTGVSLEDIAASTKIALSNLDFLEKDRYDLLPPRVFVKGFIRSYVQELGLNPEDTIKRFDAFTKEGELPDYAEEEHPVFPNKPASGLFMSSPWFTLVLTIAGVLALCILIVTGVTRVFWKDQGTRMVRPREPVVNTSVYEAQPVPPGEIQGPEVSTSAEPPQSQVGKRVLEIKAVANTWVRVEPDNGPAQELLMAPGDVKKFMAQESFNIQTGNAGGLRLRLDGLDLQTLGKANQPLSLTLP